MYKRGQTKAVCLIVIVLSVILWLGITGPGFAQVRQPPGPTPTPGAPAPSNPMLLPGSPLENDLQRLSSLYEQAIPGVVDLKVIDSTSQAIGVVGSGSGFIIDESGHILTNHHVVAEAELIAVTFYDGSQAEAAVVGVDDDSDLAVLSVDEGLPPGAHPLPLGDSDEVRVGQFVLVIGSPFGFARSLSVGVVSAVGRSIPGLASTLIPEAIQTDAAINLGNSGGPLINMNGEVVGVNAQLYSPGAAPVNSGVGFAIPSNIVSRVAPILISDGKYTWPWMGVDGLPVDLMLQLANDLDRGQLGAYIDVIAPGSPAEQAGLRATSDMAMVAGMMMPAGGDIIQAVDGKPVNSYDDLLVEIAYRDPDDEMRLTVLREGVTQEIILTLAIRPADSTRPLLRNP